MADDTVTQEQQQERGALPGGGVSEETPGGAELVPASQPEDAASEEAAAAQAQDLSDGTPADDLPHTALVQAQTFGQDNAQALDPYEGAVPPGYDWPTHGGYLGCLMGLVTAFLVGGFLGSLLVGLISVTPLAVLVGSPAARILWIAVVFVATLITLGRVGWNLGKRFYREYPRSAGR